MSERPSAENDRPVVLNPEAVGDPDQTPIVQLPPELVAYFDRTRCPECGQINHTHTDGCARVLPPESSADCPTPGCHGDARYAAPGRRHIAGCTYPIPPASSAQPDEETS